MDYMIEVHSWGIDYTIYWETKYESNTKVHIFIPLTQRVERESYYDVCQSVVFLLFANILYSLLLYPGGCTPCL